MGEIMNTQKIKAFAYSVYLNAAGYRVLRNPKGTPATTVRAIRHHQRINPETLDTFESYKRVTKDFSQQKPKKTEEYFFRDSFAFYNKDTKKVDYKTQVQYSRFSSDKKDVHANKNYIDNEILDKRSFKEIKKKRYTKREQVVDMSKAFLGYVSSGTVTIRKSLAEVETDKYYDKLSKKHQEENNCSFISTIFHNLKN